MRRLRIEELEAVRGGGGLEAPKPSPGGWGRSDWPQVPVEPVPENPQPAEGAGDSHPFPPVLIP